MLILAKRELNQGLTFLAIYCQKVLDSKFEKKKFKNVNQRIVIFDNLSL